MTDEHDDKGQDEAPPSPPPPPPPPPNPAELPAEQPTAGPGGQYVVPDPTAPPEGEATGFVPPASPPPAPAAPPPGAAPPQAPAPQAPPAQVPPPLGSPPPTGPPQTPPTWNTPPGHQPPPAAPPGQAAAVPVGGWAPPQGTPAGTTGGVGQQQWAPPPAAEPPRKRSAAPWIVGAVIALLAAVGAFFLVSSLIGGDEVSGTIDECSIAADGTLVASGTVTSEDELDTTLEIRFDDSETGTEVDRDTVDVSGGAGEAVEWTAQGQAGDDVNRVTCVLGPLG